MRAELPDWSCWFDVTKAVDGRSVRHRVLYGGRGGGKSRTIAHKLVERALKGPEQILCLREYQNSISGSSKKLIEDTVRRLGCGERFQSTETEIRGRNGARFVFLGLNGRDAAIRSMEGITLVWVEEASTISQSSIDGSHSDNPRAEIGALVELQSALPD